MGDRVVLPDLLRCLEWYQDTTPSIFLLEIIDQRVWHDLRGAAMLRLGWQSRFGRIRGEGDLRSQFGGHFV
jgi:NADPH-dependent ferric siderophore reductase